MMEKEFNNEYEIQKKERRIPSGFDLKEVETARKGLIKAYHSDLPNGNEDKLKEINIAFDRGNYKFIMDEFDLLKERKEVMAEENAYLQKNRSKVMEILDESPEVAEEVFDAMRRGDYRDAVDTLMDRLKREGKLKIVKIEEEKSPIRMMPYKIKKSEDNVVGEGKEEDEEKEEVVEEGQKKEDEDNAYSKLSKVQKMLSEMRQYNQSKEREIIENNEKREENIFGGKVEVVSFGGKKKEEAKQKEEVKQKIHKNLKEWTPEGVKESPVAFIGDILNNIETQVKQKKNVMVPRKALGIVLKLLARELDISDIEDKKIVEAASESFNGDDIDSILAELRSAEDFFRVNKVFKEYVKKEEKSGNEKEDKIELAGQKKEESVEKVGQTIEKRIKSEISGNSNIDIEKQKLAKDINEVREKIDKGFLQNRIVAKEYTINDLIAKKKGEDGSDTITTKNSLVEKKETEGKKINLNRDSFRAAISENEKTNEIKREKEPFDKKIEKPKEGNFKNEKIAEDSVKKEEDAEKAEKEAYKESYLRAVKNLLEAKATIERLQKDRVSKVEVSERLGIKNSEEGVQKEDYRKAEQTYEKLKEKLSAEAGINKEEIEVKINSLNEEIKENEARFNAEKAKEYIQHLKKIVEYQKESLPDKKKKLFEKMISVAKDRRAQVILGAVILGISIAVPEVGGAAWLTGGLVNGFLPVEAGIPLKILGGTAGGFMMVGAGTIYEKLIEYRNGIVKRIEDTLDGKNNNFKIPKENNYYSARSVGFFKTENVEIKNNFIEIKKQIIES